MRTWTRIQWIKVLERKYKLADIKYNDQKTNLLMSNILEFFNTNSQIQISQNSNMLVQKTKPQNVSSEFYKIINEKSNFC